MAANFLHGIETIEIERGPRSIRVVKSAVIVLIGTAPIGPVNQLIQCLSDIDAAQFGSASLQGYTIPSALNAIYDQGAGTVLVVNVLDPKIHQTEIIAESVNFGVNDIARLVNAAIIDLELKSVDGTTTYSLGVDYELDRESGRLTRLDNSKIGYKAEVIANYRFADPALITPAEIIGEINHAGIRSGLSLADESYNQFGYFGKIFIAPGFSTLNSVSTELIAAAIRNGGIALIDAPIGTTVQQAITGRGPLGNINFSTSSERAVLCYPHVKVYDASNNSEKLEPLSQRLAGVIAAKDNEKGYWWSPSNTEIKGIIGSERNLTARIDDPQSEVNALNEAGIVTIFNSFGTGLRIWGNRSAAWPSVTHMKNFINVRRTKDIIDESIRYSSLQFVDQPITQSLIDSIIESVNMFFRKLIGDGAILGGECWFDPNRNVQTELENGHIVFNYKLTPPPPFERGTYEAEITGEYLTSLKGGN